MHTNFQGKKVSKENASYKCLSLIILDFVIRVNKKYYPQTLLEECKYVIRKNKMEALVNDDSDLSSSDESDNESDHESDNGTDNLIMGLMMRLIINFNNGSDNDGR